MKKNSTAEVTGKADAMCTGIGGNPALFPNPNPSVSDVQSQKTTVQKAEVVAGTRAKGAAQARNVQRSALVGMLETLLAFVQGIANTRTTAEDAIATIVAAGLTVALVGKRLKEILTVTKGPEPNSVLLDANASALTGRTRKKTTFNWQQTSDGGKTFVSLPSTPLAKTTVTDLTPLTTYGFRVSVTIAGGVAGEWSQVVTYLVH